MSSLNAKLNKVRSIATKVSQQAKQTHTGIRFTDVLGEGTHGVVYSSELIDPIPVMSEGCIVHGRPLKNIDSRPAVKLSKEEKGDSTAKLKHAREFELMRWAYKQKVGPPVYCEATWDLGKEGTYHLIFMPKMFGNLSDLIADRRVSLDVKQLAWYFTFEKIYTVSNAQPPSICMDLKTDNVLVSVDKQQHLDGVFLSDFDSMFWRSVPSPKEALLFNYVTLISNTLFRYNNLCDELPCYVRIFADRLLNSWSKTRKFYDYLLKWDKQFRIGIYFYASKEIVKLKTPSERANAYIRKLNDIKKNHKNFKCSSMCASVVGAKEAFKEGDRNFK